MTRPDPVEARALAVRLRQRQMSVHQLDRVEWMLDPLCQKAAAMLEAFAAEQWIEPPRLEQE